jgi:uncharacterized protein YukE
VDQAANSTNNALYVCFQSAVKQNTNQSSDTSKNLLQSYESEENALVSVWHLLPYVYIK